MKDSFRRALAVKYWKEFWFYDGDGPNPRKVKKLWRRVARRVLKRQLRRTTCE